MHYYTYIHTSMHAYIHTYIHTSIHTYIHIYIHTYIHTYIYIYIYICIGKHMHVSIDSVLLHLVPCVREQHSSVHWHLEPVRWGQRPRDWAGLGSLAGAGTRDLWIFRRRFHNWDDDPR